jgi:hypothetical protein
VLNEPGPAVALWETPPWADSRTVDESAVEHCRHIGDIGPLDYNETLSVDVVQRDEVNLGAGSASISRGPAQVRIAGMRLSMREIRDLQELLTAAMRLEAEPT